MNPIAEKILKALNSANRVALANANGNSDSCFIQPAPEEGESLILEFEDESTVDLDELDTAEILPEGKFRIGETTYQILKEIPVEIESTPTFLLIQKGGTDRELYLHAHGSHEAAVADRIDCAKKGAYETSPIVECPHEIANHPEALEVMEKLIDASTQMEQYEA